MNRGGNMTNGANAGAFYFNNNNGNLNNNLGFRACVVSPYLEIQIYLTGITLRSYLMVESPNHFLFNSNKFGFKSFLCLN